MLTLITPSRKRNDKCLAYYDGLHIYLFCGSKHNYCRDAKGFSLSERLNMYDFWRNFSLLFIYAYTELSIKTVMNYAAWTTCHQLRFIAEKR